jgi:3-hydroxybutyryl-CoA dehydrogenase
MKKIGVIGAGTMGHGIALAFSAGGYKVAVNDISTDMLKRAEELNEGNVRTLVEAGLMTPEESLGILRDRICYTDDLERAVSGADLIVEAIVEKAEIKKKLFAELDRLAPPDAILASNTSFLDIYKFVETGRPDKVIITHWFAPPHIMPLVEIVRGPETSDEAVKAVTGVLREIGKETIVLNKFLPGFLVNRLQSAITMEVYYLLDNGYATAEEIDTVAKAVFGLRTPILGLVQRLDFNGLDLVQRNIENRSYERPPWPGHSRSLDDLVSEGKLGVKSGQGFYDYREKNLGETLRRRDIKILRLKRFLDELEASETPGA